MNLRGKTARSREGQILWQGSRLQESWRLSMVVYSGIQILFLFLRLDTGLPEGVTYSQYAHQGFWQLLAVSLINFAAVLICRMVFDETGFLR